MNWPWSRKPENRGTLTFLPNNIVILGMPDKATEAATFYTRQSLEKWLASDRKRLLVFPFPVDVTDRRQP